MKYTFSAFLFIICLCTGCASDTERRTETTGVSSPACPSDNFDGFLAAFMEDENVQRQWVDVPLRRLDLDRDARSRDNHWNPVERVRMLNREEIKFPVIFSKERGYKAGLSLRVDELSADGAKVVFAGNETDYLIYYFFRAVNGCWKLNSVEDWTL